MTVGRAFSSLVLFLKKVPSINEAIAAGDFDDGGWWVKFSLDINHPLAWRVVQELGHVVNYLSLDERLPTTFMPVSPPPYLNGGPEEFLSWVIECRDESFKPGTLQKWLAGRLPAPVEDESEWT
jgi:hypothetical protein